MQTIQNLSEVDILCDLLSQEKQLCSLYTLHATECSCPALRHMLGNHLKDTLCDEFEVFSAMHTRGWYPTQDASDGEVSRIKDSMQQLSNQL
nr:spore coat protein [bacterium]